MVLFPQEGSDGEQKGRCPGKEEGESGDKREIQRKEVQVPGSGEAEVVFKISKST